MCSSGGRNLGSRVPCPYLRRNGGTHCVGNARKIKARATRPHGFESYPESHSFDGV
jgi:hypothetical protein